MTTRVGRPASGVLLACGAALIVTTAGTPAEAGDPAAAQALFTEGRRLMTEGRFSEACLKLEESQKIDPGMGTLYHLASCSESAGRLASAWGMFLEVAALAKAQGQEARATDASQRARALEGKLPKISIEIAEPLEQMELQRDGVPVGRGQWSTAIPIDAGPHRLRATAPGRVAWEKMIVIPDAAAVTEVRVPPLALAPRESPRTAPPTPAHVPAEVSTGGTQRTLGVIVGGVGVVLVGAGGFFGLQSMSKKSDADGHCDGANRCDAAGVSLRDDARTAGTWSTVGFAAGGIALAGGVALFLTAPRGSRGAAFVARPVAMQSGGGVAFGGALP